MAKTNKLEPTKGETVRDWVCRFVTTYDRTPKKRDIGQYEKIFTLVSISEDSDQMGIGVSNKIQRAITLLDNLFPTGQEYFWDGTLSFWFHEQTDAVTFKLHWSSGK